MPAPFPTRYELKCAGYALIIAQLLWVILGVAYSVFDPEQYDASIYDVKTEEDIIAIHEVLSSEDIRIITEITAAIYWLSVPFLLVAIYGLKKVFLTMFVDSSVEMWVYVFEKAYLMSILVTNIIGPAMMLVAVSFEWSIHSYTPEPDFVPTGYYIQLYAITTVFELYDAVCIADGLFLFLVCVVPQFRYCTREERFDVLKEHGACKTCYHMIVVTVATSVLIVFLVSLFRFADHGFFSLTGAAGFLPVYAILLKFFIGFKLVRMGYSARYDQLQKVFGNNSKKDDDMLTAANDGYDMDKVTINNEQAEDDSHL